MLRHLGAKLRQPERRGDDRDGGQTVVNDGGPQRDLAVLELLRDFLCLEGFLDLPVNFRVEEADE